MFGTLISSVTVGAGGAASIDFTSIPQTYTDLTVVVSGRTANADIFDQLLMKFNGSATGYSVKWLVGNGSLASSSGGSAMSFLYAGYQDGANNTASTFGNTVITIPNYTGSAAKTTSSDSVFEHNATTATAINGVFGGLWSGTAAITSISLFSGSGSNMAQYSTAYLYGTLKGSGGATVA